MFSRIPWMLVVTVFIGLASSHNIPILHHKPEVIFPTHHKEFEIKLSPIPLHDGLEFGIEKHKHDLMERERELAHGLLEKELLEKELKKKHELLEHEHKALKHREHEILEHEKKELEHRVHEIIEHEHKGLQHLDEHKFLDFIPSPHKAIESHLPPPEIKFQHDTFEHFIPMPKKDILEYKSPLLVDVKQHGTFHKSFEHSIPHQYGLEHHLRRDHNILESKNLREHQNVEPKHGLPHHWDDPDLLFEEEVHHREEETRHHDEEAHRHEKEAHHIDEDFHHHEEDDIVHHEEDTHHSDELFPVERSGRRFNRRENSNRSNNRERSSNRNRSNSRSVPSSNEGSSNRRSQSNNRSSSNNGNETNNRRNSNNRGSSNNSNNRNNSNRNSRQNQRNDINISELFPTRNNERNNNNQRSSSNNSNRRRGNNNNSNNRRSSNLEDLSNLQVELFELEPSETSLNIVSRPERQVNYGYTSIEDTDQQFNFEPFATRQSPHEVAYPQSVNRANRGRRPVFTTQTTFENTEEYVDDEPLDRTPIVSNHRGRGIKSSQQANPRPDQINYSRNSRRNQERKRPNGETNRQSSTTSNIFKPENIKTNREQEFLTLDADSSIPTSQVNSRPSSFNNQQSLRPRPENNGFHGTGGHREQETNRPQNSQGSFFVNENVQRPENQRPHQSFGTGFGNSQENKPSNGPINSNFNSESNQRPVQRPVGSGSSSEGFFSQRPLTSGFDNQETTHFQRPIGSSGQFGSNFENQETSNFQRPTNTGYDHKTQRPTTSNFNSEKNSNSGNSGTQISFSNYENSRPQRPSHFSSSSESASNFGSNQKPYGPSHNSGYSGQSSASSFGSSEEQYSASRPFATNFDSETYYRPQETSYGFGLVASETNYRPLLTLESGEFINGPSTLLSDAEISQGAFKPQKPSTHKSKESGFAQHNAGRPYQQPFFLNNQESKKGPNTQFERPQHQEHVSDASSADIQRRPTYVVDGYMEHVPNYQKKSKRPETEFLGHLTHLKEELKKEPERKDFQNEHSQNHKVIMQDSKLHPTNSNNFDGPVSHQQNQWLWPNESERISYEDPKLPLVDNGSVKQGHDKNRKTANPGNYHIPTDTQKQESDGHIQSQINHYNGSQMNFGNESFNSGHSLENNPKITPGQDHNNKQSSDNHRKKTQQNTRLTNTGSNSSSSTSSSSSSSYSTVPTTTQSPTKKPSEHSNPKDFKRHPNIKLLPLDSCGIDLGNKIIGGTTTQLDEFPWMALLQYTTESGQSLRFGCGGSLISPRYVLTAAHCIKGPSIKKNTKVVKVRLGEFDTTTNVDCQGEVCNQQPVDASVEEIIVHPEYKATDRGQLHDIALIRLKEDVQPTAYINTICLPWNGSPKNLTDERLTVAGWGKTANGQAAKSSTTKQKVSLPGVNLEDCSPFYNKINIQLSNTQMCAGGEPGKDSCQGDSGGPLMKPDTINHHVKWQVHGVVSFGPQKCGLDNVAGVYTKVSEYLEWLLDNIKP